MLTKRLDAIKPARPLQRHAHRGHAIPLSDLDYLPGDGRMHVEVMVSIDMVQWQTGCPKGRELRLDLRRELLAQLGAQDDVKPYPRHVRTQVAVRIDKVRYPLP